MQSRFPESDITVAEIDPEVTAIVQAQMFVDNDNVRVLHEDARQVLKRLNDEKFDVDSLVAAYRGQSKSCTTLADFTACFVEFQQCTGVSLIEVLADPVESKQSNEMRLLNLYIKAKNGQPEAIAQWSALTE